MSSNRRKAYRFLRLLGREQSAVNLIDELNAIYQVAICVFLLTPAVAVIAEYASHDVADAVVPIMLFNNPKDSNIILLN